MKRFAENTPENLLAGIASVAAPRAEPRCRHFGVCGGCQLQDLAYDAQVTAKREVLIDVLHEGGVENVPEIEVHSAAPWGYRNRIRLRVADGDVGYSRRASNEFLRIEECPIASPLLLRAALVLRDAVREGRAAWPEKTVALELFADAEECAMQLAVHMDATVNSVSREAPGQFRAMCEMLHCRIPQLAGAGLLVAAPDPLQSRRVRSTQRVEIARWGEPKLPYVVRGTRYAITRGAFFQVNRFLTDAMVSTVVDGRSGKLAIDLFAGAGLFSVPLAERFDSVIAVEIGEPAASDLKRHLAPFGPQHQAVHSTSETFLQRETRRPDLVVMDPPRSGVQRSALRLLARLVPHEIVYVSCDAGTFARDAKTLLESGYTLAALHLFDLFPQTFHTETIAVFRQ